MKVIFFLSVCMHHILLARCESVKVCNPQYILQLIKLFRYIIKVQFEKQWSNMFFILEYYILTFYFHTINLAFADRIKKEIKIRTKSFMQKIFLTNFDSGQWNRQNLFYIMLNQHFYIHNCLLKFDFTWSLIFFLLELKQLFHMLVNCFISEVSTFIEMMYFSSMKRIIHMQFFSIWALEIRSVNMWNSFDDHLFCQIDLHIFKRDSEFLLKVISVLLIFLLLYGIIKK